MAEHLAPSTTQQTYPGRATWRTIVQNILSAILVLGVIAPIALAVIDEEQLADFLPDNVLAVLVTVSALLAAVSGALARIMAIPQVDAFLQRFGLASSPRV